MQFDLDFTNIKVLIVGDVMIDRYMYGDIFRMSPEDNRIPVLENINIENRLGGAANVALNINALGAEAFLCGVIGNDENEKVFRNEMNIQGLSDKLILNDSSRKTTVKTRVISNSKHIVRVDMEDTFEVNSKQVLDFVSKIRDFVSLISIDMIIFQDYNKGFLTKDFIEKICMLAKEFNILTAVDPKKTNFFEYKNIDVFKPNRREVEDQFEPMKDLNIDSIARYSDKIREINNAKSIIITLSEHGIFYDNGEDLNILPIISQNDIVDVSGAGDSVLSIICLAYIKKMKMIDIIYLSNMVGQQVCGFSGVKAVDLKLLKSQLGQKEDKN